MLFVWAGAALAVLTDPRRRRAPALQDARHRGHGRDEWLPSALVILVGVYVVVWLPSAARAPGSRSTRSARTATPRTSRGVNVPRRGSSPTRFSGDVRGARRARADGRVGLGDPHAGDIYTLNSRRGGRARRRLAARRRRRPGRPDRGRVRAHAREDDPDHQGRRPELGAGDPGHADRVVVMIGGLAIRQKGKSGG